jgi:hypothetical protein
MTTHGILNTLINCRQTLGALLRIFAQARARGMSLLPIQGGQSLCTLRTFNALSTDRRFVLKWDVYIRFTGWGLAVVIGSCEALMLTPNTS